MVYVQRQQDDTDRKRKILKQMENVGYLGSMIHTTAQTAGSEGAWIKGHRTKNHKKGEDKRTLEAEVYT